MAKVPSELQDSPGTCVLPLILVVFFVRAVFAFLSSKTKIPVPLTVDGSHIKRDALRVGGFQALTWGHCFFLGSEPSRMLFPLPEIPFPPWPGWCQLNLKALSFMTIFTKKDLHSFWGHSPSLPSILQQPWWTPFCFWKEPHFLQAQTLPALFLLPGTALILTSELGLRAFSQRPLPWTSHSFPRSGHAPYLND